MSEREGEGRKKKDGEPLNINPGYGPGHTRHISVTNLYRQLIELVMTTKPPQPREK